MDIETIKVGSVSVLLIAQDDRIVAHLRKGQTFEPRSLAAWARMCADGGTALDIGAYSGLFSIAAAKMGCKVIAFEPMPQNAKRLRENAKLNGVEIDLRECVVSDHVGKVDLAYNPNVVGMTAGASLIRKSGPKLAVKAVSIDSLELMSVRAIKIDVERAEFLVLKGAEQTLARCKPEMLVEALGSAERQASEAVATGYKVKGVLDVRNLYMMPC